MRSVRTRVEALGAGKATAKNPYVDLARQMMRAAERLDNFVGPEKDLLAAHNSLAGWMRR